MVQSVNGNLAEIQKNIFQIRAKPPSSHAYLIKGKSKNILIDTGLANNFDNLKSCLFRLGLDIRDIHLIVLTHEHIDHAGCAKYFVDTSLLAAHSQAANKISLHDEFAIMNKAFHMAAEDFHIDVHLEDSVIIDLGYYRLKILHTPGHCSGCLCIHEEKSGVLFSGDTVLAGGIITGIFPSGSMSDYIISLRKLLSVRIKKIFPGHGKISEKPYDDINQAIENAKGILTNTRVLFNTLNTKKSFEQIFKAARKFTLPK